MKKNKSEIEFTPAPNQETFKNLLKDFANELPFFYFLFPADILNDTVYQAILYSTQKRPESSSANLPATFFSSQASAGLCTACGSHMANRARPGTGPEQARQAGCTVACGEIFRDPASIRSPLPLKSFTVLKLGAACPYETIGDHMRS